jgi:hypothetical protein
MHARKLSRREDVHGFDETIFLATGYDHREAWEMQSDVAMCGRAGDLLAANRASGPFEASDKKVDQKAVDPRIARPAAVFA